jgi:hypothetical protein
LSYITLPYRKRSNVHPPNLSIKVGFDSIFTIDPKRILLDKLVGDQKGDGNKGFQVNNHKQHGCIRDYRLGRCSQIDVFSDVKTIITFLLDTNVVFTPSLIG